MIYIDRVVEQLDAAVQTKQPHEVIKKLNDHLVGLLRKKDKEGNLVWPDPDWSSFPIGRDFFTQNFP